jgi:hypothetical protein
MDWLLESLGAIGGLVFGAVIVLLMAPTLDSMTPVNMAGLALLFLAGSVILTAVLIVVVVRVVISEL